MARGRGSRDEGEPRDGWCWVGTVLLLFVHSALQNEGVSDKGEIQNGLN